MTFQEGKVPIGDRGEALLAVHEPLDRLREQDARKAQVVLYRFFGGMTNRAIADVLDISTRTVQRDWRAARGLIDLYEAWGKPDTDSVSPPRQPLNDRHQPVLDPARASP